MRTTLALTLLLLAGFILTNFLMFFNRMDLTPHGIQSYYLGNEENFHPARSYQSMIETTHSHLPMMALVLLLLTHLIIFAPFSKTGKYIFIVVTFLSALLNEGSNYLIRFLDPDFAWVKIAAFSTLQFCLITLVTVLAVFLIRAQRESKNEMDELVELQ